MSRLLREGLVRLCMVCSSGGHFLELKLLRDFWSKHDRFWISFPRKDVVHSLEEEEKIWAYYPTNRSVKNFLKNLFLAARVLISKRPDMILTTGAGVGVPFIYLGKIMGITTVYIESPTRIKSISLSGRLVYPFVDHFLVHWQELAARYPRVRYRGSLI